MPCRMIVHELKADWPALAEQLGYRTWSHKTNPCFLCTCSKENMVNFDQRHAWVDLDKNDYEAEVLSCTKDGTLESVRFTFNNGEAQC
jgi:hypothetical protein